MKDVFIVALIAFAALPLSAIFSESNYTGPLAFQGAGGFFMDKPPPFKKKGSAGHWSRRPSPLRSPLLVNAGARCQCLPYTG